MFDLQRKYLLDQQVEFILSGEQNFFVKYNKFFVAYITIINIFRPNKLFRHLEF